MKAQNIITILGLVIALLATAGCTSYDEDIDTVHVRVKLDYPSNFPLGPYRGARVELTNANASTFVDSTDNRGVAEFDVPGGLYDAASSQVYIDTVTDARRHWRYILNGRLDDQVVSPDSMNNDFEIKLSCSRKRYWH